MQYGKIENGALTIFDGGSIRHNGRVYVNLTEETLRKLGYKPIIDADMPEAKDGYYITVTYSEDAENIYRRYEPAEVSAEDTEIEETEADNDTNSDN